MTSYNMNELSAKLEIIDRFTWPMNKACLELEKTLNDLARSGFNRKWIRDEKYYTKHYSRVGCARIRRGRLDKKSHRRTPRY